jgi:hypothetical protein
MRPCETTKGCPWMRQELDEFREDCIQDGLSPSQFDEEKALYVAASKILCRFLGEQKEAIDSDESCPVEFVNQLDDNHPFKVRIDRIIDDLDASDPNDPEEILNNLEEGVNNA